MARAGKRCKLISSPCDEKDRDAGSVCGKCSPSCNGFFDGLKTETFANICELREQNLNCPIHVKKIHDGACTAKDDEIGRQDPNNAQCSTIDCDVDCDDKHDFKSGNDD